MSLNVIVTRLEPFITTVETLPHVSCTIIFPYDCACAQVIYRSTDLKSSVTIEVMCPFLIITEKLSVSTVMHNTFYL